MPIHDPAELRRREPDLNREFSLNDGLAFRLVAPPHDQKLRVRELRGLQLLAKDIFELTVQSMQLLDRLDQRAFRFFVFHDPSD